MTFPSPTLPPNGLKTGGRLRISAIVPTLDEAVALPALLRILLAEVDEVVVVDGGSQDATVSIAQQHGATVVSSDPGRGRQLNSGVRMAKGEVLWFVHADTHLPPGVGDALRRAATDARWGCFGVRVHSRDPRLRWTGRYMGLRARLTGSCTGDMAIWAHRDLFHDLDGFREISALEDLDFVDRARRMTDCTVVPIRVGTSARRWKRAGINRTITKMWAARLAYRFGLDPERVARWYAPAPKPATVRMS